MTWGEIHNEQGFGGRKPEGKTTLRRKCSCEDIVKTDPKRKVEWKSGGIRFILRRIGVSVSLL